MDLGIKPLATYFVLVLLGALVVLHLIDPSLSTSQEYPEPISGAYHGLTYQGLARTYPYEDLPANAHYAAWESWHNQHSQGGTKNNPGNNWRTLGPHNFAGRTLKLAFNPQNPNTLYAGSASGGLWRSNNQGKGNWTRVPIEWPVLAVSSIAFSPNDSLTMYIGTGEVYNIRLSGTGAAYRSTRGSYGIGILKSTDGGNSWSKSLDWSYNQSEGVWDIDVSQVQSNVVFTATTDGVYRSDDGGDSWARKLNVAMANSLVVHQKNDQLVLVGCGNFGSPGGGIYRSIDGGENWSKVSSSLPLNFQGKIQLEQSISNPNTVYGSIGNGFGFNDGATWTVRSDDFGETWTVVSTHDYSQWQGWFSHDVAIHPDDPNVITVGGIGLWQSIDGGQNFLEIASNGLGFPDPPIEGPDGPSNYIHSDIHDVIYHPSNPDILFIASDGGIHQSEDGGLSFASRNSGYQTVQFYNGTSSSQMDNKLFVGGLQDNGTILYDGSLRWRRISGGDGSWANINPMNDDDIIVSSQFLNIKRSEDSGKSFSNIRPPINNENTVFIAPFVRSTQDPSVLYAGRSTVYKSTDFGMNWTPTNGGRNLDGQNGIMAMAISSNNPKVIYAATAPSRIFGGTRGQVFVSRNAGESWARITGPLPDRFPMDMAVDPFNPSIAYVVFSGFGTGHVYKTSDQGQTWNDITSNLPDVPTNAIAIDPRSSDVIYIGNDLGAYITEDGGMTWSLLDEGLDYAVMVFDLSISPLRRTIRLASHGNGAFERDLLDIPPLFEANADFSLKVGQNPVRQSMHISYKVVDPGKIQIRLIDVAGRIIRTYVDDQRYSGEYQFSTDVSQLPAAPYFLQIQGPSEAITEKIIVAH